MGLLDTKARARRKPAHALFEGALYFDTLLNRLFDATAVALRNAQFPYGTFEPQA